VIPFDSLRRAYLAKGVGAMAEEMGETLDRIEAANRG
jgi:hypothetical protein